ncbi:glycoside hydrolase family 16 protein [Neolewinella aurantiaca]|uniref:Glycoside hydrolase family 16 protein n=2 Tax=Neolewinella aurantiaca TaxID=2602767 RepID=A0A5C7F9Q6_9BACT|nr:glycoside hydrolase family 16 protein [Neolewinella aurantiaca]
MLLPLVVLQACSRVDAGDVSLAERTAERQLVWSDEFSGTDLDAEVWTHEPGDGCPDLCGWGNGEVQYYTKDNHRLEDGKLIITAEKNEGVYTSTRITTKEKQQFRYGRIEARVKLPVGKGLVPAFWMLGQNIDQVNWPACGEIDILKYKGQKPGEVLASLHTQTQNGVSASTKKTRFSDIEEGFHRYAAEWTPENIAFFVDDQWVHSFEPKSRSAEAWPFDKPFFLLLNLAVGGTYGGPEVDDSVFPQDYVIDYIRVYAPE